MTAQQPIPTRITSESTQSGDTGCDELVSQFCFSGLDVRSRKAYVRAERREGHAAEWPAD